MRLHPESDRCYHNPGSLVVFARLQLYRLPYAQNNISSIGRRWCRSEGGITRDCWFIVSPSKTCTFISLVQRWSERGVLRYLKSRFDKRYLPPWCPSFSPLKKQTPTHESFGGMFDITAVPAIGIVCIENRKPKTVGTQLNATKHPPPFDPGGNAQLATR